MSDDPRRTLGQAGERRALEHLRRRGYELVAANHRTRHGEIDLIVCDGHGLAHPRRFGLACHLGVALDIPTIGCGKTRLTGEETVPGPARGAFTPLLDGAEVPVAVRVRRPDDAQVSTRLQRAVEGLTAEQAALRKELAARPDAAAALEQRLGQLELWVARLDARLGEGADAPAKAVGGGFDPWQVALAAVLAGAASAALALAVAHGLG